jgi:hypothetical protein
LGGGIASSGGGIYCWGTSIKIKNNIIAYNRASEGAGIYCGLCPSEVINNRIIANIAGGGGGGVYCGGNGSVIMNNEFIGNTASNGGGISFGTSIVKNLVIHNNTITANTASGDGGALYGNYIPGLQLSNNILSFNTQGIKMTGTLPVDFKFGNNCVYGNSDYNYSGISNQTGINGNISYDPNFVRNPWPGSNGTWGNSDDDFGDLRLTAGSHCIDTGDNASIPADILRDLSGEYRVVNGGGDPEPVVDIGAYEYYLAGDMNESCSVNMEDFNLFTEQWLQGECTKPDNCGQADIDRDGVVEVNDLILFAGHWLEGIEL